MKQFPRTEHDPERPAHRVLVVERKHELRRLLGDLLRRKGLDVTEQCPETTDLLHGACPYDAVVFNADQKAMRRHRWLFGVKPSPRQTRLVALHETAPDSLTRAAQQGVDATLPYPFSVTELVNAVLGNTDRISHATQRSSSKSPSLRKEPYPRFNPKSRPEST